MPIPFFDDDDEPTNAYDAWMDRTNEGRGFDPSKGAAFVEPLKYMPNIGVYIGQTQALCGLLNPELRPACPDWVDYQSFLKGKNQERLDLYSATH